MLETTQLYAGYGSLVSKESALRSCPNITNFELCEIIDVKRVFGKVDPYGMVHGHIKPDDLNIADCYVRPSEGSIMIGSVFEVPQDEIESLRQRECQYYEAKVTVKMLRTKKETLATIFMGYADESDYRSQNHHQDYPLWPDFPTLYQCDVYRSDILPSKRYLKNVMMAYAQQGQEIFDNFISTTWLADQTTPLKAYLSDIGWNIHALETWTV